MIFNIYIKNKGEYNKINYKNLPEEFVLINNDIYNTCDKIIISAGNSYGYMDGGSDLGILKKFPNIEQVLEKEYQKHPNPVSNPFISKLEDGIKIISVPTMPIHIKKMPLEVIYLCYFNLFTYCFYEYSSKSPELSSISMPLFGCGYGRHSIVDSVNMLIKGFEDAKEIFEYMTREV